METFHFWLEYKLLEEKCRTILEQLKATNKTRPAGPLSDTEHDTLQLLSAALAA